METEKCVLFLKFEICELSRAIKWSLCFPVEELSSFLNRHLKIIIYSCNGGNFVDIIWSLTSHI